MPNHHNCAVATCTNNGQRTKGTKIAYHQFPKDPETSAKWLSSCNRGNRNFNPQRAHICSVHFVEEDYVRDLQNELLGLPVKRKLKPGCFPTVNLGKKKKSKMSDASSAGGHLASPTSQPDDLPSRGSNSQAYKDAADELIAASKRRSEREKAFEELLSRLSAEKTTCTKATSTLQDKMEDKRLTVLQKERDALVKENRLLKSNLQRSMAATKDLRDRLTNLKKSMKKAPPRNKKAQSTNGINNLLTAEEKDKLWRQKNSSRVVESLAKLFSVSQMKYLVHRETSAGRKRVNWTTGDITAALVLREQSKKNYAYLRQLGYPFPSFTTLREWAKNSFADQEICEEELFQEEL